MKSTSRLSMQATIIMLLASLCFFTGCSDDTPLVKTNPPDSIPEDTGSTAQNDTSPTTQDDTGPSQDDIGPSQDDAGSITQDDTGHVNPPGSNFQLTGQLVPSGGYSMSNTFSLSGSISPGIAPTNLKGGTYHLTMTP